MQEFKKLVSQLGGGASESALRLEHFGGANQITGYRLYYMLQRARRAGVKQVTLVTDGGFWIEEAGDWLVDSGVDAVIVEHPHPLDASLAGRIEQFASRADAPPVVMQPTTGQQLTPPL